MTQSTHKGLTFIVILMFASVAWTQDWSEHSIRSYEAKNHYGELAMVCGDIVGDRRKDQPLQAEFKSPYPNYTALVSEHTILYFDKLPPNHEFMVVIEDVNRRAFPDKLESFVGQKACVYGKILKYREKKAVMALVRADQIAVAGKGKDRK